MLDQLVESRSHAGEDNKKNALLLGAFVTLATALIVLWGVSLFGKDFNMGGDDLSLETLVAPPIIEEAPEPEPEKPKEQ